MKTITAKSAILAAMMALPLTGCVDEVFHNDDTVTEDQLDDLSAGLDGLVNAVAGYIGMSETYGSSIEFDLGYPALSMIRDIYCSDFTIHSTGYDYFYYWAANSYLGGNYSTAAYPWRYYYKWIENANIILRKEFSESRRHNFGVAHFYRAWAYMDLARLYEYRPTGVAQLDAQAEANGIAGLTVPCITETTTEDEARNTPRLKFYDMYAFILADLRKAETYLADCGEADRKAHNVPDISVVDGLMARFYLEVATRFELRPADLSEYLESGIDLGAMSAAEAFNLAADYARKAIDESSSAILDQSTWFGGSGYNNGFNSASDWMLGAIIGKEILSSSDWRNFIGHLSPEQYYGVGGITCEGGVYTNTYGAQRTIGRQLFEQISDSDWRKLTWLSPDDAGQPNNGKYRTTVADGHFRAIPAYASFKFRPKNGERSDYSVGSAADFPLMRIEEMHFILAEAQAAAGNIGSGIGTLEALMRTRCADYTCTAASLDDFREELMLQKRIEFWGEGIVFWDFKRLALPVVRGYRGTNVPSAYRLNSIEGYCAPWFNAYIPTKETGMNPAMKPNPDPSGTIDKWEE